MVKGFLEMTPDIEVPRFHDWLTEAAIRNCGHPPSCCKGALRRVNGHGHEIDWHSPWLPDDTDPGEGPQGTKVLTALFECIVSRTTIVVSAPKDENGKTYLRIRNPHSAKHYEPGLEPGVPATA